MTRQEAREKAMQVEVPPQLQVTGENKPPENNSNTVYVPTAQSNLINQRLHGIPYNQPLTVETNQQTEQQEKNNEPVRTYIPSPEGVKITNQEDLSAANKAMQRADAAEKLAMETLKMN